MSAKKTPDIAEIVRHLLQENPSRWLLNSKPTFVRFANGGRSLIDQLCVIFLLVAN
jgi:hypothetical protein